MPSIQYKMINTLFRMLRVNKMLYKEGPAFDKLLENYREKQKKPLAIPYKKMAGYNILTKTVNQTTVYVIRKKGTLPGGGSTLSFWRRLYSSP